MKRLLILLLFALISCDESDLEPDLGGFDQDIYLFADRQSICAGQSAQIRAFSLSKKLEIPISQISFDPIDPLLGSINSEGIFTAASPEIRPDATVIPILGSYKSKPIISPNTVLLDIEKANTTSKLKSSVTRTPFGFYNQDEGRPYKFLEDGSVLMASKQYGGEENTNEFELQKYTATGILEWKKSWGTGNAEFLKIKDQLIYLAGQTIKVGGARNANLIILDLDGNVIKEINIPTNRKVNSFGLGSENDFYFSFFDQTGNSPENKLIKYDPEGQMIWEVKADHGFVIEKIFTDGTVFCTGALGMETPNLFKIDRDGQKTLLRQWPDNVIRNYFETDEDIFGFAYSEYNSISEITYWYYDLLDKEGNIIISTEKIGEFPMKGPLVFPIEQKIAMGMIKDAKMDSNGDIHMLSDGFWGYYDFLVLRSSKGDSWNWWEENKERTIEGVIKPLQLNVLEDRIQVFAQHEKSLVKIEIAKDYNFNNCLLQPFWNKLEMF
jgi:hypothetical protein